jgi:hypothetical protein
MVHFNYYPSTYTGTCRSFRIVQSLTEKVWNKSTGTMVDVNEFTGTYGHSEANIDISFVKGIIGYPVTLPSGLPSNDYDLLIFDASADDMTASIVVENGFGIRWNGSSLDAKPVEYLSNKVW